MAVERPHHDRYEDPGAPASGSSSTVGLASAGPTPRPSPAGPTPGPSSVAGPALSDEPVHPMGRAAALLGVTQAFLRSLDAAGIVVAGRSTGGHRRYSAHQLAIAARIREVLDEGLPLAAAGRIVLLEDRLSAAHRRITELGGDPADIPHQARNGRRSSAV